MPLRRTPPVQAHPLVSMGWTLLPPAVLLSITAGQALGGALIAHWALTPARRRRWPAGLRGPLLGFLGWIVLAALLAGANPLAAAGKWAFLLLLPAAYAHAAAGADIQPPLLAFLATAAALLPSGAWTFLHYPGGRARGFSGGAPHLGTNLMLGAVIFGAMAFASAGRGAARLWAAGLACATGLALTLNRGAMLGLAVAAGLVTARRRPAWLAVALGLVAAAAAAFPNEKAVLRLRTGFAYPVDDSSRERVRMWGAALRMMRNRPLAGVGTREAFIREYATRYKDPAASELRPGHVHNSYLQTAVLHGVPGLGLLLWWLAVLWNGLPALGLSGKVSPTVTATPQRSVTPSRPPPPSEWPYRRALKPVVVALLVNAGFDFVLADGQHAMMWSTLLGLVLGSVPEGGNRGSPLSANRIHLKTNR